MINEIISKKAIKQVKDFNNFLKWAEEKDEQLILNFKQFVEKIHKSINK